MGQQTGLVFETTGSSVERRDAPDEGRGFLVSAHQ
jgi:hypothetical protein